MPFYFRKSVSAGPFRFNFSKSGVGASVGVKGFRIGTGPRGHYVHAGRGGIYYRASLNPKGDTRGNSTPPGQPAPRPQTPRPQPSHAEPNVDMIAVSSADVLQMQDERFSDLLAEIRAKQDAPSMAAILGGGGGLLTVFALFAFGGGAFLPFLVVALLALAAGAFLDSYKRCAVLFYELEDDARSAYENLTKAYDGLVACAAKWHVDSGGAVRDIHAWKRNSGASTLLDKRPTVFAYELPRFLKCNITPPAMKVGKETILFLPDVALVIEKTKVGAVAYDSLEINWQDSNFIEDGNVPGDAQVLYHVWKHPNKSGGPDRRFANNYQIPVCLYETIYLTSRNGLNELLQVSRKGATAPFAEAVKQLAKATGSSAEKLAVPELEYQPS